MKLSYSRILTVFLFSFIFIFSCNEIENPLKEVTNSCGDEDLPIPIKKILVEDFTGHKCVNCPDAAKKMHELIKDYCDHIVPLAMHVTPFARPWPDEGLPEDFRTETGTEIKDFFEVPNSIPIGMVNRTEYEDELLLNHNVAWQAAVVEQLTAKPEIDITLINIYNVSDRSLSVNIALQMLVDLSEDLSISVYLTEDSIIAPQLDHNQSPSLVDDYVHMHMFRASLNGTWGDEISGTTNFGDILEKKYTTTLGADYNENHCKIVVFIYKTETKEVIQAESEPVIQ